jgi:hypothetical protein
VGRGFVRVSHVRTGHRVRALQEVSVPDNASGYYTDLEAAHGGGTWGHVTWRRHTEAAHWGGTRGRHTEAVYEVCSTEAAATLLIAKAVLFLRSGRSLPLHKQSTALAIRQAFTLPNCQGLFAVYNGVLNHPQRLEPLGVL